MSRLPPVVPVGILSWGLFRPARFETAAEIAARIGVPVEVVETKMGVRRRFVPGPDDHVSAMAAAAGRQALDRAGVAPDTLDLVLFHGSEYKDFIVWSAAVNVQGRLDARRAWAFETYALCAGLPIALKVAKDMIVADPRLRRVLLVTASREGDLIDPTNPRTRWMAGFGAGGGAILLARDHPRHVVLGAAVRTDPSLTEAVVMPGGGTRNPPSGETVRRRLHFLDVADLDAMARRLEEVSLPNYLAVIDEALRESGLGRADLGFLAVTHMKRSFHDRLVAALGLPADRAVRLDDWGHMQSVDQVAALEEGVAQGKLGAGRIAVLAAAGTGYTWSAVTLRWGQGRRSASWRTRSRR
jgi:3-oxoacyl-[acyl-carrier-protein] synthase-3